MKNPVTSLLTMSEQLLEMAREGRWQDLAPLMEKRDALLNRLAATNATPEVMRQPLARLQVINAEITQLAEQEKQGALKGLKLLNSGNKMQHAYHSARHGR